MFPILVHVLDLLLPFPIPSHLPESGFKRTTEVLVTMGSYSISRDSHQGILFLVYIPCETTVYFRLFGERTVEVLGTRFLTGCYRRFLMIMDSKRGEKLEVVCSKMVLKHLRLIHPRTSPTEWERESATSRDCQKLLGPINNRTAQRHAAHVRNHNDDNDGDENDDGGDNRFSWSVRNSQNRSTAE